MLPFGHIELIVPAHADGARLDRYLKSNCRNLSYVLIQKLVRKGKVKVNGKKVKGDYRLFSNDKIIIFDKSIGLLQVDTKNNFVINNDKKQFYDLRVYQDNNLLIINKPAELPVQGGRGILHSLDQDVLPALAKNNQKAKLVHRLDAATSGVMLVALNRSAAAEITKQFRQRTIGKLYYCVVGGVAKNSLTAGDSIFVVANMETDKPRIVKKLSQITNMQGKDEVSLLNIISINDYGNALLCVVPLSGRKHQIRRHVCAFSQGIIGDKIYASRELLLSTKLLLQANRIVFRHPKGMLMDVSVGFPSSIRDFCDLAGLSCDRLVKTGPWFLSILHKIKTHNHNL